ncbi:membrane-associated progesterone-binding protein 4 [Cryptomeria japonica]|uniref:membrane-associated progesterone-binding protein 4 n=1 Tax=Cryptomeria japonica TaxID=3369 RepID=UPI0027DA0DC3|nr:membrane-associated progesterone-binding protein 4 [Cryptomeria japonica]
MAENSPPVIRSRPAVRKNENDKTLSSQEKIRKAQQITSLQIITSPSSIGLVVTLALVTIIMYFGNSPPMPPRLWTKEELAKYNGTEEDLPILLGILGSVFDVTKGRSHYGVGGSYNHFAGRDASRAFVSGNFTGDGLTDQVKDLANTEIKSIVDWRNFYHRSYIYVGNLVGRYYNREGKPTKELKGVEAKAARGSQLLEKQKEYEDKLASCNSRWSDQSGGEVWCDSGYPRLVQMPAEIALTGKISKHCACLKEDELNRPGVELYVGCDPLASLCKL